MANTNNNNTPIIAELAALDALEKSMIGNHNFNIEGDDEPEELKLKSLNLDKEDLILFNDPPMIQADYIQSSELNNKLLTIFSEIFADVFSVRFTYDQQRGFIFMVSFRYLTEDLFKSKNKDSEGNLIRCITSSIDPDDVVKKNSIAANIMLMVQHQQINSYDASKYAKITKDAKELLTDLLFFSQNNKKKRWVNGENYTLSTQTGTGFNGGRTFTNIVSTIFLDAEKVLSVVCGTESDKNKYEYNIIPTSNSITGTDSLIKIEKVNKTKKNKTRNKYGIQFSK